MPTSLHWIPGCFRLQSENQMLPRRVSGATGILGGSEERKKQRVSGKCFPEGARCNSVFSSSCVHVPQSGKWRWNCVVG